MRERVKYGWSKYMTYWCNLSRCIWIFDTFLRQMAFSMSLNALEKDKNYLAPINKQQTCAADHFENIKIRRFSFMTKTGKHWGKRRICSFWSFFSFISMFSKSHLLQRCQKASIWGNFRVKWMYNYKEEFKILWQKPSLPN